MTSILGPTLLSMISLGLRPLSTQSMLLAWCWYRLAPKGKDAEPPDENEQGEVALELAWQWLSVSGLGNDVKLSWKRWLPPLDRLWSLNVPPALPSSRSPELIASSNKSSSSMVSLTCLRPPKQLHMPRLTCFARSSLAEFMVPSRLSTLTSLMPSGRCTSMQQNLHLRASRGMSSQHHSHTWQGESVKAKHKDNII